MTRSVRVAVIAATFAALATIGPANATCFQGSAVTYGDIETVGLSDCVLVNLERPCFAASVNSFNDMSNGHYLGVGAASHLGYFDLPYDRASPARFGELIRALRDARILERPLQYRRTKSALLDGRRARILIVRCDASYVYDVPNYEFSQWRDEQRWEPLVDRLGAILNGFPWNRVRAPNGSADTMLIYQFGAPRGLR